MTNVNRLRFLRYGLHAGLNDFTSTPALTTVQPTDDGASFMRRSRTSIERPLASTDGRRFVQVRGGKDVAPLTLPLEFKGVNTNTGAAVPVWEAKMEQGGLLASIFGAVAPATVGVAPTVAAAGHTPATGILAVVGTTTANGQVIGFPTASGWQVGQIVSGGGTTALTLDRAYDGVPTTGANVIRAAVYNGDPDKTEHVHAMFSSEHVADAVGNLRTDYFGCCPMSAEITFPDNGLLDFSSTWGPTNWEPGVPTASPTFVAPTAGSPMVNDGYRFRIGNALYVARSAVFSIDNAAEMRVSGSSINGVIGGVCAASDQGKVFMLTVELYFGGGAAITEILENSGTPSLRDVTGLNDAAGDLAPTYDVALGFGTEAGAFGFLRFPAADVRGVMSASGSFPMVSLTIYGTGALPCTLAVG